MKILLVGSTAANSGDASLLLKRAFEHENHQVRFISTNEDRPFAADILFTIRGQRTPWIISQFSHLVFAAAKQWRPDLVFFYGSNLWVNAKTIQSLQKKLGCKVLMWEVNNGCFKGYQAESIPLYDHIFILDSYMVPILQITGARQVHHLSPCIDPKEHHPVQLNESDIERFASDLSFVGEAYPVRVELLKNLTKYNLRIYGRGWEKIPALNSFISEYPVMDLTKLKIYSATLISLNIHGQHMINGENFRVFEVAACGGVSFSLFKPDLLKCFEPDTEVIVFEDMNDLRKKIEFYLKRPELLREIGEAARRRVLSEHTYVHRVQTIMKILHG